MEAQVNKIMKPLVFLVCFYRPLLNAHTVLNNTLDISHAQRLKLWKRVERSTSYIVMDSEFPAVASGEEILKGSDISLSVSKPLNLPLCEIRRILSTRFFMSHSHITIAEGSIQSVLFRKNPENRSQEGYKISQLILFIISYSYLTISYLPSPNPVKGLSFFFF